MRKITVMRALLDNDEVLDLAEPLPHFRELHSQQLPEKRADAHVREEIAMPANCAPAGGIISVLGMIQRLVHEPAERLRAAFLNFCANKVYQGGVAGGRSLHRSAYVKTTAQQVNR